MLAVLLAACTPTPTPPSGKLPVVATNSILGDLVTNVGGAHVDVHVLVGPGVDPHTFQYTSDDMRQLDATTLVFENGLGFEPWLDKLYETSGSQARRVAVTASITPRVGEGGTDPHVWHDVANAVGLVEQIRAALVAADPPHAADYDANAAAYTAQLRELDDWIVAQVATLPPERRKLVTSHDTFGYFADRYGFTVAGTALRSVSTEAADPSAADIAALIDAIKAEQVPAIFAENVHNDKLMRQIAADAGVTLAPPLYTDALGPPGSPGATYIGMMRYNVTTIVTALASPSTP
jgi:zinc/manganese transport system substrate-binding protein